MFDPPTPPPEAFQFYYITSKNESPPNWTKLGTYIKDTILRYSVKKLVQSDNWFLRYGQKTIILGLFFKMA